MPSKFSTSHKSALLGMPIGTAQHRLRKTIMFDLVKRCGLSKCFRCGIDIALVDELSIEHKNGWQLAVDPVAAFFDIEGIAFSHLQCNIKAGVRPTKKFNNRAEARLVYSRKPTALVKKAATNAARNRRKHFAGMV